MPRYIDADDLLSRMPDDLPYKSSVKRVLTQAPTADVGEVVRCDHCENFIDWEVSDAGYCVELQRGMPNNGFCCLAKRKEKNDG